MISHVIMTGTLLKASGSSTADDVIILINNIVWINIQMLASIRIMLSK